MTELESMVAKMLRASTMKERAKTARANQRADAWRERALTYRDHMTRYQRELAEARSALRRGEGLEK